MLVYEPYLHNDPGYSKSFLHFRLNCGSQRQLPRIRPSSEAVSKDHVGVAGLVPDSAAVRSWWGSEAAADFGR